MANPNPTIVVASLDDSLIKKSINELVQHVNDGAIQMAKSMDDSVQSIMKSIQKLGSAKVSGTTGSGGGGAASGASYDNSVKALREQIALEKEKREAMAQGSQELLAQNGVIQNMEQNLKKNLKTQTDLNAEYRKDWQAREKANMRSAMSMSEADVSKMQTKLHAIEDIIMRLRGKGILSEADINRMTTKVEKLRDNIDKIQKQGAYAPKNAASVLGMPESTLDEINKKLQAIKQTKAQLNINTQKNEINSLNNEAQRLTALQNEILGKNAKLTASNTALGNAFGYIRNRIIYALTLGVTTNFVKQVYEIRGQYELLERSLGVLLNSFENGSRIFQELNSMAIKSPFTLIELAGAAKQLTAYNFEAKEVVDTTRRLADISAALGVPMERLTYNLGQIRAQTVLTARDARDFANAGLPIVKSLADYFTELEGKVVTTGDVYDRMSKKMVSYTDVMAVLNKMTDEGGKFFDFQAKQAQTLRVQMANLSLAFNNMLNDIGKEHQSLLSKPLQILKSLLENWRTIERAIWDVVYAISAYKAASILMALTTPVAQMNNLSAATASMVAGGNKLIGVFKSLGVVMKNALLNPVTWILGIGMAINDVFQQLLEVDRQTKELNNEIKKGAQEASTSIGKFLKANSAIRESLSNGKLTSEQATKAWDSMSDEIETSAASSNSLLAELMRIDDVTERVRKGFRFLEVIQESQEALEKLKDTTISVSQTVAGGLFGEGLADDLQDYINAIKELNNRQAKGQRTAYEERDVYQTTKELEYELTKVANQIKNFISANGIHDPLQINEIVERIRNTIKMNNPKIQGELERAFDINLDNVLSRQLGGFDKTKSITKYFVDDLKKGYSSAFGGLTDEMYESTFTWNATQKKAIDDTLEKYKETMPEYYEEAVKLVNDISKLKAYIGIAFNIKQLSPFQKDFQERIGANWDLRQFMPQANDDLPKWVETMKTAIANLEKDEAIYAKDNTAFGKQRLANIKDEISLRKQALDLYHQSYAKEKKTKSSSQKDELGEALKQEISLIKDMQSNYEKLRKAGVGDFEAIELAARGYEATLERVNLVLSKYGIDKFNANQFAGKNVKELLEFLVKQREILSQNPKVKTSAIEALDVEIQKLQVDAKTYDFKKITDGLNNELAKIDEQYELAVELQANADLGNQLIDMFGIDTTDFPKSIDDLVARYQSAVWDAIAKEKPDVDLSQYDILDVDFSKLFSDKDIDSEFMKGLLNAQKNIKQQTKKWAQDVYNQTKQLEYNLADTNGKIALKEQEINELRDKYANEQNAKQKELYALQIKEQENVLVELKEGILQMMPAYEALFGGIANHSAALTRTLAKRLKSAYEQAKEGGKNEKGEYTYIDPKSGEYVTLTEHKLGIEIDKVNKKLLESQPLWQKLKEDFTKGADDEVDFAQGLMDIADEMEKVADGINEIGNIAEGLGADEETLEIINDIGASIDGVATAAKGIAQIQSGDVIGGTVNVIKGAWGAISSWFDNSNKRITREVERSERTVRQLELAYKDLEYQVEKAMGTAETAARRATIANKQQQLEELKRQLALEESRKKKNQDEDKMLELRGNIKDLQYEINNMTEEVVNNLTGSDVKSAAEEFVDTWVEAWKAGETTLDAIGEKMDEVIQNIVKKAMTQKIVGALLQPLYNELDRMTSVGSEGGEELTIEELRQLAARAGIVSNDINTALGAFYGNLEQLGLVAKTQEQEQQLSALQQGIQGVTEQTANALEGYMNGLSQQAYLRNDLLMQIRDALTLTDNDMAMGVQAQILLQLQQSYVLIQSIHSLMGNWTIPNGSGIRVELI